MEHETTPKLLYSLTKLPKFYDFAEKVDGGKITTSFFVKLFSARDKLVLPEDVVKEVEETFNPFKPKASINEHLAYIASIIVNLTDAEFALVRKIAKIRGEINDGQREGSAKRVSTVRSDDSNSKSKRAEKVHKAGEYMQTSNTTNATNVTVTIDFSTTPPEYHYF